MAKKLEARFYAIGLKVVFSYLKEHSQEIYFLIGIGLVLSVANALLPFATGRLLDAIIAKNTSYTLFILWFLILGCSYIFDQIKTYRSNVLGRTINSEYTHRGLSYLLKLPISAHKSTKMSVVASTINGSGGEVENIASGIIINLAPQFLSIIFALVISFSINVWLTLIMIGGVSLYLLILIKTIGPSAMLQKDSRDGWRESYKDAVDAVDNVLTVKQMGTEEYQSKKNIKNYMGMALVNNVRLFSYMFKINLSQRVIITLTQALVFLTSIYLIFYNEITVGDLLIFNGYVSMVFGPFVTLASWWRSFQNGLITLEQSEKFLNLKTEQYIPPHTTKINELKGKITFKNVDFYYNKSVPVLKDINFTIQPGEVVALVGKSGEGKSTLINLISGYHFPKKGQVLIDNINIKNIDLQFLRQQIAVVPQEVVLFNNTIEVNVKYGSFNSSKNEVEEAARKAHALEFIEKFPKKWKQVVGERGVKLSVGQKQRVAIARAILRNPKILILDEPTSALDAESEHFITKALEELMQGRTTFIIAHRLSTVRRADKILVFKDGQIAEMGKHEELIQKEGGVYRHLYELQIGLHQ